MGRALVIGSNACRVEPARILQQLGFTCAESDDPYAAMHELCQRPLAYRAMILSLRTVYREELAFIGAVKRRFPHVEIWLTQTDGRQSALAEAMRQGADGLLDEEGLHRTATGAPADDLPAPAPIPPAPTVEHPAIVEPAPRPRMEEPPDTSEEFGLGEPILTAEELRALLQEQPSASDPDGE